MFTLSFCIRIHTLHFKTSYLVLLVYLCGYLLDSSSYLIFADSPSPVTSPTSSSSSVQIPPQFTHCKEWKAPLPFGPYSPTGLGIQTAKAWKRLRYLREQERMEEAYDPAKVIKRYRIEHEWIHPVTGCLKPNDLIDLGRALFLRRFTRAEGFGSKLGRGYTRTKFQKGHQGGPDATACVDCHWKGGFAGGGDRDRNPEPARLGHE